MGRRNLPLFRDYVLDEADGFMLVAIHQRHTNKRVAYHIISPEGAITIFPPNEIMKAEETFNAACGNESES